MKGNVEPEQTFWCWYRRRLRFETLGPEGSAPAALYRGTYSSLRRSLQRQYLHRQPLTRTKINVQIERYNRGTYKQLLLCI